MPRRPAAQHNPATRPGSLPWPSPAVRLVRPICGVRGEHGEHGAISIFVALVSVGLLVAIGLIADVGGRLRAIEQADAYAAEAARAGGQRIDPGRALTGRGIVVDAVAAQAASERYLTRAGQHGTVSVDAAGHTVRVTVDYRYDTSFLAAVGISSLTVHGEGSASLLYGVTEPENS